MTNAQQEIQAVIDDLSAKIVDLETRTAALKDLRYYARNVLSKYEPNQFVGMTAQEAIEFEDKELPSSGIYADESSYTAEDKAAALVHDAELDPALVELCSNTTIHADKDGWIRHVGDECPLSDEKILVHIKTHTAVSRVAIEAGLWTWKKNGEKSDITHWRYHN